MGKAIIIGAFELLGFQVCKRMLDQGYEVIGLSLIDKSDSLEEEMLLEIGRNSNFAKAELEALRYIDLQDEIVIYSLYDIYHDGKVRGLDEKERWSATCRTIFKMEPAGYTVLLLPGHLQERFASKSDFETIDDAALLAAGESENMLKIYLPGELEGIRRDRTGLGESAAGESHQLWQVTNGRKSDTGQFIMEELAGKIVEAIDKRENGNLYLEKEVTQRKN